MIKEIISKALDLALGWTPLVIERIRERLRPNTSSEELKIAHASGRCALAEAIDSGDGDKVAAVFKRGETLVVVPMFQDDGDGDD
jgi:hypothetical protein